MEQKPQMNIDFSTTTPIVGENENHLFGQAYVLRKVSKFTLGSNEDAIVPIPVFYDLETNKIITDSLPPELREEYKDISIEQ